MIEGLELTENWLDAEEQRQCEAEAAKVFSAVRPTSLKRDRSRVLRYGWAYETPYKRLSQWPSWLEELRLRLPYSPSSATCAVTLNEYAPGHRIGPHVDSEAFGDAIQILSLGSPAEMEFSAADATHSLTPTPGSLLLMQGPARHEWKHAIRPVLALRYSIVFREILTAVSSMTTTTMS